MCIFLKFNVCCRLVKRAAFATDHSEHTGEDIQKVPVLTISKSISFFVPLYGSIVSFDH